MKPRRRTRNRKAVVLTRGERQLLVSLLDNCILHCGADYNFAGRREVATGILKRITAKPRTQVQKP